MGMTARQLRYTSHMIRVVVGNQQVVNAIDARPPWRRWQCASASRPMGSRSPVSTNIVWPEGETKSVDCPPSVSIKYTLSVPAARSGALRNTKKTIRKSLRMRCILTQAVDTEELRHVRNCRDRDDGLRLTHCDGLAPPRTAGGYIRNGPRRCKPPPRPESSPKNRKNDAPQRGAAEDRSDPALHQSIHRPREQN